MWKLSEMSVANVTTGPWVPYAAFGICFTLLFLSFTSKTG